MLLVTLLALPFLLPPAAVVAVFLLVYQVVEAAVWVPLRVTAMIKDKLGRPRKDVISPRLSFKL